jgi:hypothetical protein
VPPPSTTTVEPVENRVDARNKTAFATSEGSPMRLTGNRSAVLANGHRQNDAVHPWHDDVGKY